MSKLQKIKFPLQNRSHLLTSRFADGKYRQATVATIVPLRKFCRFLRKKWLAAAWANSKTNLRPPGRDFRCRWLTSLFIKQIKSIFALSHIASTAPLCLVVPVFLFDSRTWIPLRIHEKRKARCFYNWLYKMECTPTVKIQQLQRDGNCCGSLGVYIAIF